MGATMPSNASTHAARVSITQVAAQAPGGDQQAWVELVQMPALSRRSSASSCRSVLVRPPSWRSRRRVRPALPTSRTAVSVRSNSFATWSTDRSPRWHSSTISALNSGVNERRRRGFCPMLSMIGHHSGGEPLMTDVRQSGSGPVGGGANVGVAASDPRHRYSLTAAPDLRSSKGLVGSGHRRV
jgi:hypothetical protein